MISVRSNAARLEREVIAIARKFGPTVRREFDVWARKTANAIKPGTPVMTGQLKKGVSGRGDIDKTGVIATIRAATNYAAYVEHGTRRMKPRRFFFPVIRRLLPKLREAVLAAVHSLAATAG
jgi:HK97 gp10 family phage protein